MELYFFKKLFFRYDTLFNATDLITHHIICNRSDDNIIIVNLCACAILTIIKHKTRPLQ